MQHAHSCCALLYTHTHTHTHRRPPHRLAMTSIKVPDPVMSLALTPRASDTMAAFMKALTRFQKEDPTFKVRVGGGFGRRGWAEGVFGGNSGHQVGWHRAWGCPVDIVVFEWGPEGFRGLCWGLLRPTQARRVCQWRGWGEVGQSCTQMKMEEVHIGVSLF